MSAVAALASRLAGRVTVVGVGNPLCADDGAGPMVARALEGRVEAVVVVADEVPENHIGVVAAGDPNVVVFIDAVDMGARPGAIALLEGDQLRDYPASTHRVPLWLVMNVVAQRTGADVVVLGVQPASITWGAEMSGEVRASARTLAEGLSALLGESGREGGAPC